MPVHVHRRLARPVPRELGLRAIRIEDAQAPDDASAALAIALSIAKLLARDQEHPVGADAEVARADEPDARRGELEGQLGRDRR